LRLSDPINF